MPVARHLVRERAHVAGALHVVLATQRVHADAVAADIAGGHGEIGDGHHRGRALAVLGDAEAVIDRAVAAGGVEPRRAADRLGGNAGELLNFLRAVARARTTNAAQSWNSSQSQRSRTNFSFDQAFGDDDMGERGDDGDVGARLERQMVVGLDMRRAHEVDAARIEDDQPGALAQPLLHARGEHRMAVGRIGADDHDHVGLLDRVEVLRAGRGAVGGLQAIAGRRVAHARAGVDIVVAEGRAHELLHQEGLLVGAARRGDAADRAAAIFRLDALELGGARSRSPLPRTLRATDR